MLSINANLKNIFYINLYLLNIQHLEKYVLYMNSFTKKIYSKKTKKNIFFKLFNLLNRLKSLNKYLVPKLTIRALHVSIVIFNTYKNYL